jgi:hypothetical protein
VIKVSVQEQDAESESTTGVIASEESANFGVLSFYALGKTLSIKICQSSIFFGFGTFSAVDDLDPAKLHSD